MTSFEFFSLSGFPFQAFLWAAYHEVNQTNVPDQSIALTTNSFTLKLTHYQLKRASNLFHFRGQLRFNSNHWRRHLGQNIWNYQSIPPSCVTHSVFCIKKKKKKLQDQYTLFTYENLFVKFSIDINECVRLDGHDCHDNALCTNTKGSFICECLDGYSGSGKHCSGEDCLFVCLFVFVFVWLFKVGFLADKMVCLKM